MSSAHRLVHQSRFRIAILPTLVLVAIAPVAFAPPALSGIGPVHAMGATNALASSLETRQGARGDQTILLQLLTANVGAGSTAKFALNVSPAFCGSPSETFTVLAIRFSMGDGFQFSEPGVAGEPSCNGPTGGYESIDFGYVYAGAGTYRASALVTYYSGENAASNVAFVNITGAPAPVTVQLQDLFYGVGGSALLVVVVLMVLRRRLPPPPSLPPSEV